MQLRISEYPQLRLIAWNRRDDDVIGGDEALALYERNWCYVDRANLTDKEQQLIDRLVVQYGNGVLHVWYHLPSVIAAGGTVALTGFGSFQIKDRAARNGRNPQNGETIKIAESKIPGFKPGKSLKDAVNAYWRKVGIPSGSH